MRENDRHWMDAGCHDEWNTKKKKPMDPEHFDRYMDAYSKVSNETTVIGCLADEGKEWKDRDQDEWCCEKCWKTETVIRKRNISLFWDREWVGEEVGREDYCVIHMIREKEALLTYEQRQKMIETEIAGEELQIDESEE